VTVRERDTTAQVRVPVDDLPAELDALRRGEREFADLQSTYEPVTEA
jgi:glycyl-tRNA synthetase